MAYQPIQNYGIIGNMYTTALVGLNGAIDWFCFPNHDSPSVFAALLDHQKGGHFKISPLTSEVTMKQFYWPETNVLITRFLTPDGVGEIADFMPVGIAAQESGFQWLVRRVKMVRGCMDFMMECHPAFNYARDQHQTTLSSGGACFHSPSLSLELSTDIPSCSRFFLKHLSAVRSGRSRWPNLTRRGWVDCAQLLPSLREPLHILKERSHFSILILN